jgi:two-component system phosphate regulon sensor histidine kinase PhoR
MQGFRDNKQDDLLLAQALPEGIIILDHQGKLIWWNDVALQLLTLTDSDRDRHLDRVLHKKLLVRLKAADSLQVKLPDLPDTFLQMRLRPYWDHQHVLIIQDVTLTQKLESMRKEFIANVSHELRTPLTVFHGYVELLKESPEIPSKQLIQIIKHMEGEANRMRQLVEDLLLLSRLESVEPDPLQVKEVHIASLLTSICDDAKSLSGKKHHHFILELDETLNFRGDLKELRSAFSNLIYNAVHYTPDHGTITIRWYQKKNRTYMEVQDTGIGIAEKHIPRLTERFYRVDKARSSQAGGTGLGLAIVKHVLLRHHGDLEIDSKLCKGSLFRCVFVA